MAIVVMNGNGEKILEFADEQPISRTVTAEMLAEMLRVKRKTVMIWAASGRIPSIRVNRRTVRFEPEAVLAALRQEQPQG